MAAAETIEVPPDYPRSGPGYGKHTVPTPSWPATPRPFDHLADPRQRRIAHFVDRLPDGACMSVKQLRHHLPRGYGLVTIGRTLNELSLSGNLRRVVDQLDDGRTVTRTYWSRRRLSEAEWAEHLSTVAPVRARPLAAGRPGLAGPAGSGPAGLSDTAAPPPRPSAAARPTPPPQTAAEANSGVAQPSWTTGQVPRARHGDTTEAPAGSATGPAAAPAPDGDPPSAGPVEPGGSAAARQVLDAVARVDPRLTLSVVEIRGLAPAVDTWFAHGITADQVVQELTRGLPAEICHPGGLIRKRLDTRRPEPPPPDIDVPAPRPAPADRRLACTSCHLLHHRLTGGLCPPCRDDHERGIPHVPLTPEQTRERIGEARRLLRLHHPNLGRRRE